MILKTKHGYFLLIKNYKDAFEIDNFIQKYVPSIYDKYAFIVGDVSSTILRLTGFSRENNNSNTSYNRIPDYLDEYCNIETAYYILKRISEEDANIFSNENDIKITDRSDQEIIVKNYIKKEDIKNE